MREKKIKWQPIVKATSSLLFQWYVFEGHKEKYFRSSLNLQVGLTNEKIISGEVFIDLDEWAKLEETLAHKIKSNPTFYKKFIQLCYQYSDELIKTAKRTGNAKHLEELENRKLLSLYIDYQDAVLKLMPFLNATLALDAVLNKEIVDVFKKELGIKDKKKQDLLLSKLVIPKKKSFFVQEQESLLNMAFKLQKNRKLEIKKAIEEHLKKYAWMSCLAYVGQFQTEKDIRKKISELLKENPKEKLAQTRQIRKETQEDYQEAFEQIKKSERLVDLIDYAREFIYLKQYRLDVLFMAHYYVYPLFMELGKRFKLKAQEVVYLTSLEIIDWLKENKSVEKEEIKKRVGNFALLKIAGQYTILSGSEVKKIAKKVTKAKLVKGAVANRGRITAPAKLVYDVEDILKVNKGDIIISPMTRPELVPAIVKASGIITDFGGMLCHAAIISREFGIPCIVGTKKATKVFKDGDVVELNAYDGVARKLEK